MHYWIGNLGHLFVIISFVTALVATFAYLQGYLKQDISWVQTARTAFYVHTAAVTGIVVTLFLIIQNNYFEYHYAWSHSSKYLPFYYKISAFWEGQEGSFLLWLFWHVVLGVILIRTSRNWESPAMFVFSLVQAFLASMILGIVVLNIKIGSSPFMLLRDVMDAPVFKIDPEFVPVDGSGLNPLLQNYWMVIHPPTLFLGFATTIVPFSFAVAGLWMKKYTDWIRPALPWSVFSAAILGLGIIMGAYWAYETLNFGGYWNWDPVENAIFVPWLTLIAGIHTMVIFRKNATAIKTSFILVIATFILILYSTFLTRSGILGNASVHGFTDLGLSGQLLIYLLVFTLISAWLLGINWKQIPVTEKEASTYSSEFWIFIGAAVLSLSAFQVIVPTSIPVMNAILQNIGFDTNIAPPADQVVFYSDIQIWFGMGIAILTGMGQIFWWKKISKDNLFSEFSVPIVITLVVSMVIMLTSGLYKISFLLLVTSAVFAVVSNIRTLIKLAGRNFQLSGGAVSHIGVALMLIGILYSSGLSNVVSLNRSGVLYSTNFPDEVNQENVLLFQDESKTMDDYDITYTGKKIRLSDYPGYYNKGDFDLTNNPNFLVAGKDFIQGNLVTLKKGDTVKYNPENTYYEVHYSKSNSKGFYLYPRLQENPNMGNVVSPSIKRSALRDIYTHVTVVANEEKEWSDLEEVEVKIGDSFFANDFVSVVEKFQRVEEIDGISLNEGDVAVKAVINVQGQTKNYVIEPVYLIRDNYAGRIPAENLSLGIRITIMNIIPEKDAVVLGINTSQKDYIILKAIEKPLINVLWLGTIILMSGFTISIVRRVKENNK